MSATYTSVVDEHISIKPIPEEDNILLVFEVDVSPREEVRVQAEWTGAQRFQLLLEIQRRCV